MIITRTPFRISFVGGGTDLRSFYSHEYGQVLNSSIDKFQVHKIEGDLFLQGGFHHHEEKGSEYIMRVDWSVHCLEAMLGGIEILSKQEKQK